MSSGAILPMRCWTVMDGDELVLVEAQMPMFWRRDVARRFNNERLGGSGKVVRVVVSLVEDDK